MHYSIYVNWSDSTFHQDYHTLVTKHRLRWLKCVYWKMPCQSVVLLLCMFYITKTHHSFYDESKSVGSNNSGRKGLPLDIVSIWYEQLSQCHDRNELNSSSLGQNGRHFADDIFKCIFLNDKVRLLTKFHWSLFLSVKSIITRTQHWFR